MQAKTRAPALALRSGILYKFSYPSAAAHVTAVAEFHLDE